MTQRKGVFPRSFARIGVISGPMLAGVTVIFGQGFGQAISFARNVILARILLPSDFGIAVTFITVGTFFQMVADLAFDKFLIRNSDSDPSSARDSIHFLNIIRGLITGGLVFLLSPLIGRMFSSEQYWYMYALLGLLPIIKGFEHLDYKLVQREIKFYPEMICVVASQALGFVAAIIFAVILPKPSAVVIGLAVQYVSFVAISHLLATSPYSARFDRAISRRVLHFGLPLVGSGWLSFIGMQGDRIVVGSLMGVRELASYATVTLVLSSVNTLMMAGLGSVAFSMLAKTRGEPGRFQRQMQLYAAASFAVLSVLLIPLTISITFVSRLLFGAGYHVSQQVACYVGIAIAISFFRSYLSTILLSVGRSIAILGVNALRALGVLAGAFMVWRGFGLEVFTGLMVLTEFLSCIVSFALAAGRMKDSATAHLRIFGLMMIMLIATYFACTRLAVEGPISLVAGAVLALGGLALLLMTDGLSRSIVRDMLTSKKEATNAGTI